ncbi:S-adenosyl-L-methionine-dependent methyltransferase [Colletotrichum somersetense]|nr:S-adenosyl-L-methionine-dependent methyltransferase [Colletotrichum somersetense]
MSLLLTHEQLLTLLFKSIASSTTSLASSVLHHRVENGRTYHKYKDGNKLFKSINYLQHNLFLLTTHYKLGLAPPAREGTNVKRVLDVGTGTDWPLVFGVDLSPVQTTFVPPNVKFEVDDTEEPWTYHLPFDHIHTRAMTSSISDWAKFFKQSFDSLEPGGYLELQEGHVRFDCDDETLKPGSALMSWVDKLEEACNILGRPFVNCDCYLPLLLKEAGFIDISVTKFKWPLNPWPKDPYFGELGTWQYENFVEGIEAWSMAPFTRALGWTKEEINVFLIDVRKDIKDRGIHAYCPM